MIKYRATKYSGEIEEVEIKKETEVFVVFNGGNRQSKSGNYESYFDTFNEAKSWLMICCDIEILSVQRRLDQLKSKKQKINNTNHANHPK